MSYNKRTAKKITSAIRRHHLELIDILSLKPLYQKNSEGVLVPTHPWSTSFGIPGAQGIFRLTAKMARHILNNFGEIADDDPQKVRRNRKKIESKIDLYMRMMERGVWHPTNQ